ncbi:MAG: bifunctional folylpolyglutamate synthase/dihydrofolate synthase [Candidatus Cloacimonetes bacterium]|nr:bifunctional folylpolyglutamate synthase/dihydrofolate synthase [Candidatus Cloacimonadota bacterium]
MNFKYFLDSIYQRNSGNVKLGLERMLSILKSMDSPHLKLQGIHIAGTNGKGSTAAMIEALALAHDIKTGLNTSPHLVDYNERIRFNRKNISDSELMNTFQKWQQVFEDNEASFFEITTSMAFYLFHKHQVDLSIFEVGLGGRLDGTNPFKSTVTAITSISYDHPKSLGDSVEKIAFEKAGIIKQNTPLVLGKIPKKLSEIIKQVAEQKNAQLYEYGKDFQIDNITTDENSTTFDYLSDDFSLSQVSTNLIGSHQAYNAAVALTSFSHFMKKTSRKMDLDKVRKDLKDVFWLGRMQIISRNPLVIIDGAHNEEGMKSLVDNIAMLFPQKKIHFILAILRDKKLDIIIKKICSLNCKIYITKNNSARAAEIDEQKLIVQKYTDNYQTFANIMDAVNSALKEVSKNEVIVISGSLYTISEVLKGKIFFK